MGTTRTSRHVDAPRPVVYEALLDADAIARWRVPDGMTSHVHEFDVRPGGSFRISLTYGAPDGSGKTTASTDTFHGRFVKLLPNEQVVEVIEFESENPDLAGEMTVTTTLADSGGGTDVIIVHEGIPGGVSPSDNETGTKMALDNLATVVEKATQDPEHRAT